ncbi:hypothetical protein [Pedobacter frigidisoli]|nr:hypothetical protein [Pedobacter frigidisoli]
MAIAHQIKIGFMPDNKQLKVDTTAELDHLFQKSYSAKGDYAAIVHFLDTLSNANGNGRIAWVESMLPRQSFDSEVAEKKLTLSFRIVGQTN